MSYTTKKEYLEAVTGRLVEVVVGAAFVEALLVQMMKK